MAITKSGQMFLKSINMIDKGQNLYC